MAIEQYSNNAATTLNGAINNSTTSVVVTTGSVFPSTGNFRIIVDDEIMLVTARSSNTLTVTRGAEGTTAASHADLADVTDVLTRDSLLALLSDANQSGVYASLPSAGRKGRLYKCTDNRFTYIDNGSSWDAFHPMVAEACNPNLADFTTWVNQDSFTIDVSAGYHRLYKVGGSGNAENNHLRMKSTGGLTTWSMRLIWDYSAPPGAGFLSGMYLRNSSNSKFWIFGYNAGLQIILAAFNSETSFQSTEFGDAVWSGPLLTRGPCMLQMRTDNTNFYFEYSYDGVTWVEHRRIANSGAWMASYDQIGFGIDNFNALTNQVHSMSVHHAVFG